MHTKVFRNDEGEEVRVHHDGDWSGVVIVGTSTSEVLVPGWVVRALVATQLRETAEQLLEDCGAKRVR